MSPEIQNAINSTARAALNEYFSKTNTLTYRQILNKHATKIAPLIPAKHRGRAWMLLNVVCQRIGKGGINIPPDIRGQLWKSYSALKLCA